LQQTRLDSIDLQIIRLLARDSRTHYMSISSTVGITPSAAKKRINKMVSNGVIRSFAVIINPVIFGYEKECILIVKNIDNTIKERDIFKKVNLLGDIFIYIKQLEQAAASFVLFVRKGAEDTCLYKRLFMDYTYGIGKIYTAEEIEKAKRSPSFEREYNLKYLGKIGNVFHTKDIEAAIEKGKKYNPDNYSNAFTSRSMGIDPAYGSSAFGIVVTEWADGIVQIMHAEEYHRPDYNEMLSLVYGLMSKYNIDSVYVDGANPSFIRSLKLQIGEDADYDRVIARYKAEGLGDSWTKDMRIIPVNFGKEHKAMLGHCKMILEKDGGRIAINPDRFDKLITALRTAVDNDGTLDKEATSYNDIFDAFRLALKFYSFRDSSEYD
jgi:DNA-binding Lrp family transcriptional regulator